MTFSPATIAAQREDLLRQVVFNRPDAVPSDDKRLFTAEIGLTVHAYMADVYAAALAELDPERAEEVARELADDLDAGSLPAYAWERAVESGHDPQVWRDRWLAGRKDLPLPGPARLRAELEHQDGEARFWEFEYREAMDNYRGEAAHAKSLRAELADQQATHRQNLAVIAKAFGHVEAGYLQRARAVLLAAGEGADRLRALAAAPACTCGARPVHQTGCDTDQDN